MALYTDFFIADPSELRRAFVGWRRPAPTPEIRSVRNPFTGKLQDGLRWVPDPADAEKEHEQVEPFAGATLGQRLSAFSHLQLKNLDPLMLAELVTTVVGGDATEWLVRIGNPPPLLNVEGEGSEHAEHVFWELPAPFVDAVASHEPSVAAEIAQQWVTSIASDWSEEDCVEVVRDLSALAKKAKEAGKRVYYWA